MIKKFEEFLNEEMAMATAGNTGGMGAVTAPIPSSTPGDVAGSTPGSGDLPAHDMGKSFKSFPYEKKKDKKKKDKKKDKKKKKRKVEKFESMYITKYTDWDYPKESKINEDIEYVADEIKSYLSDIKQGNYILVSDLIEHVSSFYKKSKQDITKLEIQELIEELGDDVKVIGKDTLQKLK